MKKTLISLGLIGYFLNAPVFATFLCQEKNLSSDFEEILEKAAQPEKQDFVTVLGAGVQYGDFSFRNEYLKGDPNEVLGLTSFWSEEYVGADLASQFLRNQKDVPVTEVPFAVWDSGFNLKSFSPDQLSDDLKQKRETAPVFDSLGSSKDIFSKDEFDEMGISVLHGSAVGHIILGPAPHLSSPSRLAMASTFNTSFMSKESEEEMQAELERKQIRLINISSDLPYEDEKDGEETLWLKFSKDRIITVAVGNAGLTALDKKLDRQGIVGVGSLSPWGTLSEFTQTGDAVIIFAPADLLQQSKWLSEEEIQRIRDTKDFEFWTHFPTRTDVKSGLTNFGGTSGASPLVGNALAYTLALLPELSVEQARELLKASALPGPVRGQAGILNTYRLTRIAHRIALACKNEEDSKKRDCYSRILSEQKNKILSDLKEEAEKNLAEGLKAIESKDSTEKKHGLDLLRAAFFLAELPEARDRLVKFYRETKNPVDPNITFEPIATYFENFSGEHPKLNIEAFHSNKRSDVMRLYSELRTEAARGRNPISKMVDWLIQNPSLVETFPPLLDRYSNDASIQATLESENKRLLKDLPVAALQRLIQSSGNWRVGAKDLILADERPEVRASYLAEEEFRNDLTAASLEELMTHPKWKEHKEATLHILEIRIDKPVEHTNEPNGVTIPKLIPPLIYYTKALEKGELTESQSNELKEKMKKFVEANQENLKKWAELSKEEYGNTEPELAQQWLDWKE